MRGLMLTNRSTGPATTRCTTGSRGSLLSTSADFSIRLPPYPVVSTLMLIFPSPPGGICLGNETAVHPQPVRTLSMSSGVVPVLATTKS